MSDNGKGDIRRPQHVSDDELTANWTRTFEHSEEAQDIASELETLADAQSYAEYLKQKWNKILEPSEKTNIDDIIILEAQTHQKVNE